MSVFLLDHIQQACSQRLKDKIASSVRELWAFVANLNRQSRSRTYVQSLLLNSKDTIESILSPSRRTAHQDIVSDEEKVLTRTSTSSTATTTTDTTTTTSMASTNKSETVTTFESILQNPTQLFAVKRVRYDRFDDELQQQAELIEKELIRGSRVFLSDFIDTYL